MSEVETEEPQVENDVEQEVEQEVEVQPNYVENFVDNVTSGRIVFATELMTECIICGTSSTNKISPLCLSNLDIARKDNSIAIKYLIDAIYNAFP